MEPVLHENAFYDPTNLTWSNGAQACEVEIDPDTGATTLERYVCVDDIGTVINPMVVEGQVPITSAMLDALRSLGVRDLAMPFTQEKVWRAIRASVNPS
jgi:CO/xanthine dehydrogenase Mo-binding subunit